VQMITRTLALAMLRVLIALTALAPILGDWSLAQQLGVRPQESKGTFRLVSVNGKDPHAMELRDDCALPVFSQYTLDHPRWVTTDSLKTDPPCAGAPGYPVPAVRTDSGYFRVARDTVHFYVYDKRIGLEGWVIFGLLRGDTLLFPGGVFEPYDPGDMVYVRRQRHSR